MNIRKNNNLSIPASIEEATEEGQALREKIGQYMMQTDAPQFACIGLNFGYFYENSPIIAYDEGTAPTYTIGTYTPSTCPGCRVPHIWLDDGRSLFDALGPDYTLLSCDPSIDTSALTEAAKTMAFPLTVIDLAGESNVSTYDVPLLLVRPDHHIAWRGNHLPENLVKLIQVMRGGC